MGTSTYKVIIVIDAEVVKSIQDKFKLSTTQQQDYLKRKLTFEEKLILMQMVVTKIEKQMVQKKIIARKRLEKTTRKKKTEEKSTPRRRFPKSIGLLQKCLISTHYKYLKKETIRLKELGEHFINF
jgi:hypothetical protein